MMSEYMMHGIQEKFGDFVNMSQALQSKQCTHKRSWDQESIIHVFSFVLTIICSGSRTCPHTRPQSRKSNTLNVQSVLLFFQVHIPIWVFYPCPKSDANATVECSMWNKKDGDFEGT
jgi:hypothetical protein